MHRRTLIFQFLGSLLALAGFLVPPPVVASESPQGLDDSLLEARASGRPVVVLLLSDRGSTRDGGLCAGAGQDWIGWLPPGVLKVVVSADESISTAQRFGASTFPQLIVVDSDGKELGRIEGGPSAAARARLERLLHGARRLPEGSVSEEDPEDAASLYRMGVHHWNRGDRCAAAQCFRKMAALPASKVHGGENLLGCALSYLGQYALDRDDPEAAETCFRQAQSRIKDSEGKYRCAFSLAMSLRKQGLLREATEVLEDYLAQASSSPWAGQALFALGYLKKEAGDGDGARRHFQACRDLVPGGLHAERSGRYLEASGTAEPDLQAGDLARQP